MRTAIATPARRKSLSIILDRLDLWKYFDAFATKDEVEAEKPDPALFVLAAKKLRVEPSDCVVIEDSPKAWLRRTARVCESLPCLMLPPPTAISRTPRLWSIR